MGNTFQKVWKQGEDHPYSESYTSLDDYLGKNTAGSQTANILAGMANGVDFYEGMGENLPEGYSYASPSLVTIWQPKKENGEPVLGRSEVQVARPQGTWLGDARGDNSIPVKTAETVNYVNNVTVFNEVDNPHTFTLVTDKSGKVTGYIRDGKETVLNHSDDLNGHQISFADGTWVQIAEKNGGYYVTSLNNDNVAVTLDNDGKKTSYLTTGAVAEMDKQNVQNLLNISDGSWKTSGNAWISGASTGGYTTLSEADLKKFYDENVKGKGGNGGPNGKIGTADLKFNSSGSVAAPVAKVDLLNEQTAKEVEQIRQQFSNVYDSAGSSSYLEAAVINNIASGKKAKAEGAINNQAAVAGLSQDGKMYNMKGKEIEGSENWSQSRKKAYNDYTQYKLAGGNDQGEISRRQADYLENGGRLKDSQGKAITTYDTAIKNAQSKNDSELVNNINRNQNATSSGSGNLVNLSGKEIKGSENWSQDQKNAYNEYYQYKKSGGKDQDTIDRLQSNYINSGGTLKDSKGNVITAKYPSTTGTNNSGGNSGGINKTPTTTGTNNSGGNSGGNKAPTSSGSKSNPAYEGAKKAASVTKTGQLGQGSPSSVKVDSSGRASGTKSNK